MSVLDKPCGIANTKFRDGDKFNIILVRDCTTSSHKETKAVGINIVEKNFGATTSLMNLYDAFGIRPPETILNELELPSDSFSNVKRDIPDFYSEETALVIVGTFEEHKPDRRYRYMEYKKMMPLIQFAESNNLTIIYAPNADVVEPPHLLSNSVVVQSEEEFMKIIKQRRIQKLLYAGYSLDEEILCGNAGIMRLYIQNRYKSNPMPKYYIISDYVSILDPPLVINSDTVKETILKRYRNVTSLAFDELSKKIKQGRGSKS